MSNVVDPAHRERHLRAVGDEPLTEVEELRALLAEKDAQLARLSFSIRQGGCIGC